MNELVSEKIELLKTIIRKQVVQEGKNETNIPYLTVYSYSADANFEESFPVMSVCLILSGDLTIIYNKDIYHYTSGEYFVTTADFPVTKKVDLDSNYEPLLCLCFEYTQSELTSLIVESEKLPSSSFEIDSSNRIGKIDEQILNLFIRLLSLEKNSATSMFMTKHLKKEIIFYLISGDFAKHFIHYSISADSIDDVYKAIDWIKDNYNQAFTIQELADNINISSSGLHHKFKKATNMAPLQCQKKMRLQEARNILLNESYSVSEVALEVGYESLSQFSRDYRRFFGHSPQKDSQN